MEVRAAQNHQSLRGVALILGLVGVDTKFVHDLFPVKLNANEVGLEIIRSTAGDGVSETRAGGQLAIE
jgi:hypothetical protein